MQKTSAIFLSVGDHSYFLDYCINNLIDKVDLFINFYGSDLNQYEHIKKVAKYFSEYKTTKFPALKKIYNISGINEYSNVFVYDDDCIVDSGNLLDLIHLMNKYNIQIISPSHSTKAKYSHPIMLTHSGTHLFRYTNFIEMNFPMFSKDSLKKYMEVYDGNLYGWGNDWWYLNAINARENNVCAIVDKICVINPHNYQKKAPNDSIDNFLSRDLRHEQWKQTRNNNKLYEWQHKNLEFIYE